MAKSKTMTPEKMTKAAKKFWDDTTLGPKVVTASKVKLFFSSMGLRVDGQLSEAIAKKLVKDMLAAANRCAGNQRATVRPVDL